MTLRGGGGPRDDRSHAHPVDAPGSSSEGWGAPPPTGTRSGGNGPRSGGNGPRNGSGRRPSSGSAHDGHGFIRFGLFTLGMVALVVVLFATVLRPVAAIGLADWAIGNPATWKLPVIGDIVAEALADDLAAKASDDPAAVVWGVQTGDTVETVGDRLFADKLIVSRPGFDYAAMEANLGEKLQAGDFRLRRDMTPTEVVRALVEDRIVITTVDVTFREGLRIEQMTAKLQTVPSRVDSKEFYDLATSPPEALVADYPWLELPEGASLEGYLYPATYTLRTDDEAPTDAEDLIRMMLDEFDQQVGAERMQVPEERGLSFRDILTLASIVEKEAVLDEERPLIAGVYQNRLDRELLLGADPTVIYAADGAALDEKPFEEWQSYFFGKVPSGPLRDVELPDPWAAWNTYKLRGMPPGPICSPTVASIDAALSPDTTDGFLYFVAIPDGGGKHDFSKTLEEHEDKLRKYGYL